MLKNGGGFRNKYYQRKNKTTLTSANMSKNTINNNTVIPKQFMESQ